MIIIKICYNDHEYPIKNKYKNKYFNHTHYENRSYSQFKLNSNFFPVLTTKKLLTRDNYLKLMIKVTNPCEKYLQKKLNELNGEINKLRKDFKCSKL